MFNNILNLLAFFEEETPATQGWVMPVALGAILILMVVFTIIPQRRNKKKIDTMMSKLRVGSKVTTIGGIMGYVTELKDNGDFTLQTGTSTMEFSKGAIYLVLEPIDEATNNNVKKEDEVDEIK